MESPDPNLTDRSIFAGSRLILIIALIAIFAIGLAIRLDNLTNQPLDFHPTRQLWSALIARGMYYQNLPSAPEWQRQVAVLQWQSEDVREPRVLEGLAVLGYRLAGGEYLWIPRLLSAIFWMLGGIPLFLLAKSLTSVDGALIALAFYIGLPYAVISSRTFMPDPLMVALLITALWAFYSWHLKPNWRRALLAGVITGLAIFIKIVAVFPLAVGMAGLSLSSRGFKKSLRNPQLWGIAAMAALPNMAFLANELFISSSVAKLSGGRFFADLLISPIFYYRWENKINTVMGHLILLIALMGLLVYRSRVNRIFVSGLWLGYIIYGMVFNHHISTHDYYSLPLIPIVALSLAPTGDLILKRLREIAEGRAYMPIAVLGVILLSLVLISWDVHVTFKSNDYSSQVAAYQKIGQEIGRSHNVVALTEDYGYRLAYWGWLNARVWPSYGDLNYMQKQGMTLPAFSKLFAEQIAGVDYFVITWFKELDYQPQLKTQLYSNYPIIDQGEGYVIFDLRHSLNSTRW